jgi:hypothetical protein
MAEESAPGEIRGVLTVLPGRSGQRQVNLTPTLAAPAEIAWYERMVLDRGLALAWRSVEGTSPHPRCPPSLLNVRIGEMDVLLLNDPVRWIADAAATYTLSAIPPASRTSVPRVISTSLCWSNRIRQIGSPPH